MIVRTDSMAYRTALRFARLRFLNLWIMAVRVGHDTTTFASVTFGQPV